MNILWLTWKDHRHPGAGGAEVVLHELSQRLVREGHHVTWLTCGYKGASPLEVIDGITMIRIGRSRYVHSLQALAYYVRKLRNTFDVVIEVVNTAPYFSVFFGRQAKRFLFYHQLAREVWFHETAPPLSYVGYHVLEPYATKLLSRANVPAITISESTRQDLARYGFAPAHTHIISQGIQLSPIAALNRIKKFEVPTLLSLGALRGMKRTYDQIAAFEAAKQHIPALQLKVAGLVNDTYGRKVLKRIKHSPYVDDIEYVGRVDTVEKVALMQRAHAILVTSVKEGWGLIVTEAASQGTPAVVYDVDGLRDSVRHQETGIVTEPRPDALAAGIVNLLDDTRSYNRLRRAAWQWSKAVTFERAYSDLKHILEVSS